MTNRDFQDDLTGEVCPGCGDEVVLVSSDDGAMTAECPCSTYSVDVAA